MFGQPNPEIKIMYKVPEVVKTIEVYFDREEWVSGTGTKITTKKHVIKIMCFFDDDFNANRYSYEVTYIGGTTASCGYGNNNEITYTTLYHAIISSIDAICGYDREQFKKISRDIKLNYLFDEEEL